MNDFPEDPAGGGARETEGAPDGGGVNTWRDWTEGAPLEPTGPSAGGQFGTGDTTAPEGGSSATFSQYADPGAEAVPERIGSYHIIRLLASGGMGSVYEAEQMNPRRRVALKVIKAGLASAEALRRFEFEAQALGRLHHPGIAQIYEAGTFRTSSGPQPFFAMEYVEGARIDDYAREAGLDARGKLELMAKAADAMDHAHMKGLIHRDLKPGNILVMPDGQPKILDFGVARAADADQQTLSPRTQTGQILGTPIYMSPEQAEGQADEIDVRSDVYTLGVILFEMLSGRHPLNVRGRTVFAVLRSIKEDEPTSLSSIDRTLRGDVQIIVEKALQKEKAHRYQTAAALAEDIRRFLRDEPIQAQAASTWYQARKFAKRNKQLVGGAAAALLSLVVGTIVSVDQAIEARKQARIAIEERKRAEKSEVDALARKEEAQRSELNARRLLYAADMREATEAWAKGNQARVAELLDAHAPDKESLDLTTFDWRYLRTKTSLTSPRKIDEFRAAAAERAVGALAYSPDGHWLVAGDGETHWADVPANARVWDAQSGKLVAALDGHRGAVPALAFSRDGKWLATGGIDSKIQIWETGSWKRIASFEEGDPWVLALAFSPDGGRLYEGLGKIRQPPINGELVLREGAPEFAARRSLRKGNPFFSIGMSPDGKTLATGTANLGIAIWDADTLEVVRTLPLATLPTRLAFSPEGNLLGVGTFLGDVLTFDVGSWERVGKTYSHRNPISSLAFDPRGSRIFSTSGHPFNSDAPGQAHQLDLEGDDSAILDAPEKGAILGGACSPAGIMAAGYANGAVMMWRAGRAGARDETIDAFAPGSAEGSNASTAVALSPKGELALAGTGRLGSRVSHWLEEKSAGSTAGRLVWAGKVGESAAAGFARWPGEIMCAALSPNEESAAIGANRAGAQDGAAASSLILIETKNLAAAKGGEVPFEKLAAKTIFDVPGAEITDAKFSADKRWLGATFSDNRARIWGIAAGAIQSTIENDDALLCLAFSADGARVYTGSGLSPEGMRNGVPGRIRAWEAATGKRVGELGEREAGVTCLAVSGSGNYLAAGGVDNIVSILDLRAKGSAPLKVRMPEAVITAVAFSPDERTVFAASVSRATPERSEGRVYLWDLPTGQLRSSLAAEGGEIDSIACAQDGGQTVAAGLGGGRIHLWRAGNGKDEAGAAEGPTVKFAAIQ